MPRLSIVLTGPSVALALLGASPSALAEGAFTASARLVWRRLPGAETCIDRPALEAAVNRRWRRQVFVEGEADLVVDGQVGRDRDHWSASIDMRRADGTSLGIRVLDTRASDCSALDDSVALALGIMLDVSRKRVAEERAAGREAVLSSAHLVDGPPISIPRERAEPRWHVAPLAAFEGTVGALPGVGLGARIGASLLAPHLSRLELSASVYGSKETGELPGARLSAWAAEVSAYPAGVGSTVRCDVGAGLRLTEFHAEGRGLYQNDVADEASLSLGPRAIVTWRVFDPLAFVGGIGGDVSLSRYRFVYRAAAGGAVSVYETAPLSARLFVGIDVLL